MPAERKSLRTGPSPSETAISESSLDEKSLCDYVVNVADGCSHGCEFCYVQSLPQIWGDPGDKFADAGIDDPAGEWGEYALYRERVVENAARDCQRLRDDWRTTRRGQGVVGISFATDCYMDPRAGELTRGVVGVLVGHQRPVRILTRNPTLAGALHGEFYASLPDHAVTIGASIPSLDADEVGAIEPGAPPIQHRLDGLANLEGVVRYVSMSPTYPTQDYGDLKQTLATLHERTSPSVVFHEPINPRSGNIRACVERARENGESVLADALERITDREQWRYYALRQLRDVQLAAEEVGQRIHLWPDEDLVKNAPSEEQREWCRAWRERSSPESIGDGPACDEPYPELPAVASHAQQTLGGGTFRV